MSSCADKLTALQQRFVDEYLVDLNQTAAYIRAGYKVANDNSAASNASTLIRIPKVAEAIRAALEARSVRTEVTQDWVIKRLKREAELEGEGASHSARVRATELLGKHVGMFKDKLEVTLPDPVKVDLSKLSTKELKALELLAERAAGPEGDPG